jgi:transposase
LVKIGEDVTEQLDVEPAKFFVHRHIRPQYACRACETITAAPIPPAVIDGGMAAVGLLTWVMISKYLDHLPLYRLEQIAARDGVILSIHPGGLGGAHRCRFSPLSRPLGLASPTAFQPSC